MIGHFDKLMDRLLVMLDGPPRVTKEEAMEACMHRRLERKYPGLEVFDIDKAKP